MAKKEDFLRELRATFRIEAAEHLQAIASGLVQLEKLTAAAGRQPVIETVFRAAHSLKGAARAADFSDIESLCQSLETLFAGWKRGTSEPTPATLDTAHLMLDRMTASLARPVAAGAVSAASPAASAATKPSDDAPAVTVTPGQTTDADTVREKVNPTLVPPKSSTTRPRRAAS